MTDLRDARLRRALDAAPDADQAPSGATRQAVREAARRAVASPARTPWWKKAWWPAPRQRMPWNAAFATVLVAGLVTVLWQGEEVPDARTDHSQVELPATAPAPRAAAPAAPPAAALPPAARPEAPPKAAAVRRDAQPAAKAPAAAGAAATAPPPAVLRKRTEDEAAKPAETATLPREKAAADSAGATTALAPAPVTPAPAPPPAAAAAPAAAPPAPVESRSAAPPAARAQPRSELAAQQQQQQPVDWRRWSQTRVEIEGRAVVLGRHQAPRLAQLIDQIASSTATDEALSQAPRIKIEVSHQGVLLGVLDVAGERARWAVPALPGPARIVRPDPGLLRDLRAEVARVLPQ